MSWIKMRTTLIDDPRVMIVCGKCNALPVTVVGALCALWSIADRYADDNGMLLGYRPETINGRVGVPNFIESLPSDWIIIAQNGLQLPDYVKHNGTTAKTRATNQKRVKASRKRNAECNGASVTLSYSNSRSKDLKEGGVGETTQPPPSKPVEAPSPVAAGCKWFRISDAEKAQAVEHYRKQGWPTEWLPHAVSEVDLWLDGQSTEALKARKQKTHHRRLYATWVLEKARVKAGLAPKATGPAHQSHKPYEGQKPRTPEEVARARAQVESLKIQIREVA